MVDNHPIPSSGAAISTSNFGRTLLLLWLLGQSPTSFCVRPWFSALSEKTLKTIGATHARHGSFKKTFGHHKAYTVITH